MILIGLALIAAAIAFGLNRIAIAIENLDITPPINTGTPYIAPKAPRPPIKEPPVSRMAQIIKREEPVDEFLKEQNGNQSETTLR